MYEKHIFPDGSKVFNRSTNQYILESDTEYQTWLNATELIYEYIVEQQEIVETTIDENGDEITTTKLVDVTIATPVMTVDEDGNEIQQTKLLNTLITRKMFNEGEPCNPIPEIESRIAAIEMYLLEQELGL